MEYCLPCFGRGVREGEREPLLPKPGQRQRETVNGPLGVDHSTVDKVVDALAALKEGKLPTQEQLNRFLQVLLKSEFLKEELGRFTTGNGPTSRQGRKVLWDVREVVEAFLQFAMEKNADDKFQDLYSQVLELDTPPIEVSMNVDHPSAATSAAKAGKGALDAAQQGASDALDAGPTKDQLAFDASTFVHAFRTIFEVFIASPIFRLVIGDCISIIKDVVAHAASDVARSAAQVEQVAGRVVQQVLESNDVISTDANGKVKLAVSVPVEAVKSKGKEVADTVAASREGLESEMSALGEEAGDKTKERILNRLQEVIARIQKDKASRSAMRVILTLARKYTAKMATVSNIAADTIIDAAREAKDALQSNSEEPTYPPHPYETSKAKEPIIDVTSDNILFDFKDILQRLGKQHSLDGLVSAFGRVIQDLNEAPSILGEDATNTFEDKLDSAVTEAQSATEGEIPPMFSQPGKGHGKAKKNKKRKKQKTQNGEQQAQLPSPISPSNSQDTYFSPFSEQGVTNPIGTYFARVGAFLDKGLDEPGWAMSKDGASSLEMLFDDGVDLINVVGETVLDTADEVTQTPSPTSHTEKPVADKSSTSDELRRQFKKDLQMLISEIDVYLSAVEGDKATMRLVHAVEDLRSDFTVLVSQSPRSGMQALSSILSWTDWIAWGIPRLLRMLPANAIPILSVEVKSGNIDCALQTLFVQGLARDDEEGNLVSASLVPDEVILTEWTEMRVDMTEPSSPLGPAATHAIASADVSTTSRVKMHLDGVRARVENMGYYFRYNGSVVGYEDEGVISVDVGMGAQHDGLVVDVEIEIENDNADTSVRPHGVQIPDIVVQDEDEADLPANLDVQEAIASSAAPGSTSVGEARTALLNAQHGEDLPLFKVIDVQVALRGLKFKIDKSKHWILNKLCFQPLAGPVVARMVKQAAEVKVRDALEMLARGLGAVSQDAKFRRERRRARQSADINQRHPVSERGLTEDEDVEEGLAELLPEWWAAILNSGPKIFGKGADDTKSIVQSIDAASVDAETRIEVEATAQGMVYTSTTTTEQPKGQPAMVLSPETNAPVERVCLTLEDICGPSSVVEEEEFVVAIGDGPQLFPGKGGPHGEEEERQGLLEGLRDGVNNAVETAIEGVKDTADAAGRVQERWDGRREEATSRNNWRSEAFNF
ncbi:hypothetical protein NLJ89_g2228 [Agrocybe chaxingu]|uniref:HAM1-like N-terminal domain-containing protein n=1 Tax=Agrocybe chaxingu TaxID=84603 RepID=A0A9W8K7W3_9AGAR|nr:hypothetical protein NLJ89_g2228 [Agrocybe chaxingu]